LIALDLGNFLKIEASFGDRYEPCHKGLQADQLKKKI